jgi:outer membrane protein TolC
MIERRSRLCAVRLRRGNVRALAMLAALSILSAHRVPLTAQVARPPSQPQARATSSPSGSQSQPGTQARAAYVPPVVRFPADGITLGEALRLTLANEPTIKLQQSELRRQEGVALEQEGVFDYALQGTAFYEYRQQELPESRKENEREQREDLQQAIDLTRADYQRSQRLLELIRAAQVAPPGAGQAQAIAAIDPDLGAQLQALDVLIQSQTNAAARNELIRIRQDFLTRTFGEIEQGALVSIEGFQQAEQRLIDIGEAPVDEVFKTGGFHVQLSRRLRNGFSFAPFFTGRVESDNFKGKPRSPDFGGKGLEDLYTFQAGVDALVPLGRGRGSDAFGAFERAARLEANASRFALQHETAVSVLNTVLAYWGLRAAQESLEAARDSSTMQTRLVAITRASIDAGELPRVDLARVLASQARSDAQLRETERGVQEARIALATAMGVASSVEDATLPLARSAFPAPPDLATLDAGRIGALVGAASKQRTDIQSAALLEESGRVLERSAETDLRPRLDVLNKTWFTALDEKSFSNAIDRWVGPSFDVRFEVEQPLSNEGAEGRHLQRQAEARQREITAGDLRRTASLSVVRTAQSLRQARLRLEQAQAAVDAFQRTIDAELERFRAGEATLIDTILTESQQTESRFALVAARLEVARLLAQLRFETGTLVTFKGALPTVSETDLVTVPRAGRL